MGDLVKFPRDLTPLREILQDAIVPPAPADAPDISLRLCSLYPFQEAHRDAETAIPMFSFTAPAIVLWNAVFAELMAKGWSEQEAIAWLQSSAPRHAMERNLHPLLQVLAKGVARRACKTDFE